MDPLRMDPLRLDPLRLDPLRQLTPLAGSKLYFLLERCLQPARQFLYL
jgi:hypothetical protein